MVDIVTRLGKGSPLTNAEVDANFTNLAEVSGVTGEPMGHEDRTTSTISFNASTRTFTIAPVASSFTVWCKGKKVVVSSAQTVVIPNTTGMHSIYYDANGTLSSKLGYFTFSDEAPTAYIYWNATTGTAPYFGDERHGVVLDWQTHEYLHRTRGAALASGFSASGYVLGGNGSSNSHAQITLEGGTFFDEDMKIIVTATNTPTAGTWEQDLTSPARIPVLYLSGTAWVIDSPTDYPLKQGTARPQYNAFSGGVWSTADVANNKYATSWILATNNLTYPVIAIIGQAESDLQSAAEAVDFTALQLPGFPSVEFRPLYKLIFQCADSCTNAVHASLVSITDIRSIAAAGTAASIVTDHGNLSGLSDDDHPQYIHVDTLRTVSAAVKASFLPSQTSNAGKFLQTDGTATSWQALTSGNVTTALGFTPYNATNPSGFITGITSGNVTTALGFTPYNATNPSGYVTTAGARGSISVTGAGSYDSATGVINIVGGVTSFNTRTGAITLSSADVTTALGFTPYNSTNPNGYLTGITSTQVTTALGYTPYNSSNPSGYITGITSGMVTTALGFTPYNNSNPSGYITSAALSPYLTTASAASTYLALSGGTMTGIINMAGTQKITTAGYAGIEYYNTAGNWEGYIGTENNTGNLRYNARLGTHTWYANSTSIGAWDTSSLRVSGSVLTTTGASSWGVYSNTNGANYSGIWFSTNVGELLLRKANGDLSTRIAADGSFAFINNNNILHAGNYNSYSPTLTGTGASGTWGISITGNAATATSASSAANVASGEINDLGAAWTAPGTSISNGFRVYRYQVGAAGQPESQDNANWLINIYSHPSGGTASYGHQLSGTDTENIWMRTVINGGFGSWRKLVHSGNYSSYSPSLTGGGASGTWSISISGNAATATSANSANSANTATRLTPINTTSTSVSTWNPGGLTYQAWGQSFAHTSITTDSGDLTLWLRPSVYTGGGTELNMYIDGDFYSGTGASRVLNAANYGSYALPLAGGTLTGLLTLTGAAHNYLYINPGNGYEAMVRYNGGSGSGWYVGKRVTSQTVGTESFHFYSEAASKTVAGIDTSGNVIATGGLYGLNLQGSYQVLNLDTIKVPGLYHYDGGVGGTTPNGSPNYRTIEIGTTDRFSQIAMPWDSANMYFRRNQGGWQAWNTVIHDGNYSSYAVPLSGGTMSGRLTISPGWTTSGRNYSQEWIELPNHSGLYSPQNSAHFYPNNAVYGAWRSAGTRNGWGGIEFDASNGNVTLMMGGDSNTTGFHNNNSGWQFRWAGGEMFVYKNSYGGGVAATVLDSSNYNSYALPLNGGTMTGSLVNNQDGGVIIESNASEYNNWLWKENAKQWGIFWFNKGSQSGQTIGTYTTIGAEAFFMGGVSSGPAMPTGWTGYQSGSYISAMISNYTGYIYSASTVYAASSMLVGGSTVLHASNYSSYAIPLSGGINLTGSFGLNDAKLYLRTNGDNNHYLWNAADDWEELVAYAGTGFRVASSTGTTLATFTTSAVNAGVALQQGGNQVLHAGNWTNYVQVSYSGWPGYPGTDANTFLGGSWVRTSFTYSNNAPLTGTIATFPSSGYDLQLNANYSGHDLYFRSRNGDAGSWMSWKRVLNDNNYTSYSPSLTGSGASGTWGISISGSAASLGGVDASNYFRSDGSYPNADMNSPVEGFWHVVSGATGAPEGYYGHRWDYDHLNNGQWVAQMYSPTSGDPGLWFRQRRNFDWQTWRKFLDSSNYSSYAVPYSGGTLSGTWYFNTSAGGTSGALAGPALQAYSTGNNAAWFSWHKAGHYAVNMGLDSDNVLRIGGWSASANRWQLDMSGNMTVAGNVTAYSDERLKKDWAPVTSDFVASLAKIKSGTYTRIDNDERQAGVSAQDFQKLLPETISADNEGMLSLAYGNAALVSAVELAKDNVELRARIERLESLINKLIGD